MRRPTCVERGGGLEIYSFETLPSTQLWLIERVEREAVEIPCAVIAEMQTDGVGSRGNRWLASPGNFFASVAWPVSRLPKDLPPAALSIYFGYLMKMTLFETGSKVWLKWPNDFYLKDRKIGGCITRKKGESVIVGIGLNLVDAPPRFGVLDIRITPIDLLESYLDRFRNLPEWKQIFSNYRLEFEKSRKFQVHDGETCVNLSDAVLHEDGTLTIGNRRVVSRR